MFSLLVGYNTTVHFAFYISPTTGIFWIHSPLRALQTIFDYFVLLRTLSKCLFSSPFLIKQYDHLFLKQYDLKVLVCWKIQVHFLLAY
jgi:hypothetical protein